MNYKIVSNSDKLIHKAQSIFHAANLKEAIHIQEVNFWLVDASTLTQRSSLSYYYHMQNAFVLFVTNSALEVQTCLHHGFSYHLHKNFDQDELRAWIQYAKKRIHTQLELSDDAYIDLQSSCYTTGNKNESLTPKELELSIALYQENFQSTKLLMKQLNLESETSIRTLINRLRKKGLEAFISHQRGFGYKITPFTKESSQPSSDAYIKELEEQNRLIQKIVDHSSIYIVTFIHQKLFCINESFRNFLGKELIDELWREEKGDFFALLNKNKTQLEQTLFESNQDLELSFHHLDNQVFKVQSFYFQKLDKHLLIFTPKS